MPFRTQIMLITSLIILLWSSKTPLERSTREATKENAPFGNLSPHQLELFSLGHKSLFDDFAYLWYLQQQEPAPGKAQRDPKQLQYMAQQVAGYGVAIESFYLTSCFHFYFKLGQVAPCLFLLKKGLNKFPESWKIPLSLGYLYDEALSAPQTAKVFFTKAAQSPKAPSFIKPILQSIAKDGKNPEKRKKTLEKILTAPNSL